MSPHNALLYNTFRASRETMRESIDASGIPIYADAENLFTTLKWFYIEDGVVKQMPYTIGQLPESVESIVEIPTNAVISTAERRIIQDSFGDAHAFAFDRGGFNLGLPVAAPILTKEIPNASSPDVFYHVIVQEFEHGYIMQQGYNRAAFPIYGEMLDAWMQDHATIEEAINDLGVPYSRQHEHEGKVFQNFRYGHIIIEGSDVDINYEEERSLDIHMNEVDVRFGRWVNRSDARKAHPDFEHEFLRTYEAYIEVHARWIAERDYSWGLIVEGNVIAWNMI